MKNFVFFIVMALMPMVLTSCGSDDDDNAQAGSIVGVWKETYYWHDDTHSFRGWQGMGRIHVFKSDGTHVEYWGQKPYEAGEIDKQGKYTFDGTYLVIDGGFKRKVTFTEDGNGFEWERTSIVVRY